MNNQFRITNKRASAIQSKFSKHIHFKQASIKPLQKAYLKQSNEIVELIAEKQIEKINNGISNNRKMLAIAAKTMNRQIHSYAGKARELETFLQAKYPERLETVNNMADSYWCVGLNSDVTLITQSGSLTKDELDIKLTNYFQDNNYKNMFSELDIVIESLDDGYKDQLKTIKGLLTKDINNYVVVMPALFSLLDYLYMRKQDKLDRDEYTKFGIVKHDSKPIKIKTADYVNLIELTEFGSYLVLWKLYEPSSFGIGVDKTRYTRNSVQHGRYNPNRFTKKQLMQLISLESAICGLTK